MEQIVGITVKNILDLEVFENARVLADKQGEDQLLSGIKVLDGLEQIDSNLHNALLLLSTNFINTNKPKLSTILPKLAKVGVGAVAIKDKNNDGQLDEMIQQAEDLGIVFIEFPAKIYYSEVVTEVLNLFVEKQTRVLYDTQDLQQTLANIMLTGGNMQEISRALHLKYGNSVAIISDYYSSFVISTTDEKRGDIEQVLAHEKSQRFTDDSTGIMPHTHTKENDKIGDETYTRLIIPIYSGDIPYGNIYIWEDRRELSGFEITTIESVSSLIALEIVKKTSMIEMENNHRSGFLQNLLSDNPENQLKAMRAAHLFDFNTKSAHQVIVMKLINQKGDVAISSSTLYRFNNLLIQILRNIARITALKILFANTDNNIVLVCESQDNNASVVKQQILDLVANLINQINVGGLADLVSIGVGRMYKDTSMLYRSFAEAEKASRFANIKDIKVVFYDEMGVYRLLTYECLNPEITIFCHEMLDPLIDYDEEKDSELIKTLEYNFKCNGNMTQLAKELKVHYNTVVYRLQKISELTGLDLADENDSLNLQIAIKIYELEKYD